MNRKKTLLICILILLAAAGITAVIFFTEPTTQPGGATRETAMLVEVTRGERGDFRPTILATGTIEPAEEIVLSPRVGGELVERARGFIPGGRVRKGELLLRIDPSDYRNTLLQRRSDLRQAVADLNIEMGRQDVALQDYRLVDEELSAEKRSLVLRGPQLDTARARVEAVRAAVRQAELELERTEIRAPFDAHILSREANVGSQVSPGDSLGRLVGVDAYWVVATVPLSKLRWITVPDSPEETGSPVRIRNREAWPEGVWRTGSVDSLVGSLDERTRLARVLVTIPDPLAVRPGPPQRPPLMIGAFVEARIEGEEIASVVRLDRDYIRKNDTVWVMEDGKLRIRKVDILLQDNEYAYIESGLSEEDLVVTTNLTTVAEGAALRLEEPETAPQRVDPGAPQRARNGAWGGGGE